MYTQLGSDRTVRVGYHSLWSSKQRAQTCLRKGKL